MDKFGMVKSGPCKMLQEDGARALVKVLGHLRAKWVSKTHLLPVPATARLVKDAGFDQDCGCHAVIDINGQNVSTYNVYGSIRKFSQAKDVKATKMSPHFRRKSLAENGFTRDEGRTAKCDDVAALLYSKLKEPTKKGKKGYRLVSATA